MINTFEDILKELMKSDKLSHEYKQNLQTAINILDSNNIFRKLCDVLSNANEDQIGNEDITAQLTDYFTKESSILIHIATLLQHKCSNDTIFLEIGVGTNLLPTLLLQLTYPENKYFGVDIDSNSIKQCAYDISLLSKKLYSYLEKNCNFAAFDASNLNNFEHWEDFSNSTNSEEQIIVFMSQPTVPDKKILGHQYDSGNEISVNANMFKMCQDFHKVFSEILPEITRENSILLINFNDECECILFAEIYSNIVDMEGTVFYRSSEPHGQYSLQAFGKIPTLDNTLTLAKSPNTSKFFTQKKTRPTEVQIIENSSGPSSVVKLTS